MNTDTPNFAAPPWACREWDAYEHNWTRCPECVAAHEAHIIGNRFCERCGVRTPMLWAVGNVNEVCLPCANAIQDILLAEREVGPTVDWVKEGF